MKMLADICVLLVTILLAGNVFIRSFTHEQELDEMKFMTAKIVSFNRRSHFLGLRGQNGRLFYVPIFGISGSKINWTDYVSQDIKDAFIGCDAIIGVRKTKDSTAGRDMVFEMSCDGRVISYEKVSRKILEFKEKQAIWGRVFAFLMLGTGLLFVRYEKYFQSKPASDRTDKVTPG